MLRLAGVSASPRPFETSGMALAMPPVPVPVAVPAPVRLNHSSTVRLDALSADAAPIVTYWLVPFSSTAWPAATLVACAEALVEAGDSLLAKSSAVTT